MSTFTTTLDLYVRYAETDAMGVVHHASYIVYMEEARSHYARERGHSYQEFEATGYFLVVSELKTRFIAPARYGDHLHIDCWIVEMKSRRVVFGYRIRQADNVLVEGETRHICIDREGNIAKIPATWRAWT